jgi:hypothetical protein
MISPPRPRLLPPASNERFSPTKHWSHALQKADLLKRRADRIRSNDAMTRCRERVALRNAQWPFPIDDPK